MIRRYFLVVVWAVLLVFSAPFIVLGQESSSQPDSDTSAKPATAPPLRPHEILLRTRLPLLCAISSQPPALTMSRPLRTFSRGATRNPFSQLAPAARTELMKRFVLLDGAGKPVLSSNHPAVRTFAAALPTRRRHQLGGAELHDNIALVPLDIRDVSELVVAILTTF